MAAEQEYNNALQAFELCLYDIEDAKGDREIFEEVAATIRENLNLLIITADNNPDYQSYIQSALDQIDVLDQKIANVLKIPDVSVCPEVPERPPFKPES